MHANAKRKHLNPSNDGLEFFFESTHLNSIQLCIRCTFL